jgi:Protein of unknown function (DUF3034)
MKHVIKLALIVLGVIFAGNLAYAGLPLNNLEGVGGVAFNPLAYPAEGDPLYSIGDTEVISTPRFGTWYTHLGQPKIDWGSIGGATTLFKRLEISEGYQYVAWARVAGADFHKNNIGAKLVVLPENSFDTKFLPEISVGTIYKTTSDKVVHDNVGLPFRGSGEDWYAVATKTITQLPLPVVLSAGALSSQEVATGVLGFENERRVTSFENIDVVLPHNFALGYEFKQGEEYNHVIHGNANYWDVHVAWLANKNLTLVLAYADTGRFATSGNTKIGLGSGPVLSAQYAF